MSDDVAKIIIELTPPKHGEVLDPELLVLLKTALRPGSAETTHAATAAVVSRLRFADSRTRLRTLLLCNWLFLRSRGVRELLVPLLPVRVCVVSSASLFMRIAVTDSARACIHRTCWRALWARVDRCLSHSAPRSGCRSCQGAPSQPGRPSSARTTRSSWLPTTWQPSTSQLGLWKLQGRTLACSPATRLSCRSCLRCSAACDLSWRS